MKRLAKKVLLIGWDAADWKFLSPLMDEGLMPTLQGLVDGGVKGRLATLDPALSPTLWTSIATGKRPYKHGIHGFTEPDPSGKNIRPIYITNRKVKAIWNILNQHRLKTNVVGWWPSHPAEAVDGVMVSNFYHRATGGKGKKWPLAKGCVYPESLSETFARLRVYPGELTGPIIQQFVPEAWKVDQSTDPRLWNVAKTTAECSTIHSAATYLMDHHEWDFMAVYYDAIDHYCHGFMKYHPPYRDHISRKDYELYKEVVRSGCRYHDMMLARLLELAGEDTTVILISDHGFHPDQNRPKNIPKEPAGPEIEHSPFGIVVLNGPGIKKDELVFGANLLDITPTILSLFGLPVAEDMDGKVLIHAFEEMPEIETIRSWENFHPDKKTENTIASEIHQPSEEEMEAELRQLIALGYISDPGEDREAAVKSTLNENNYYLARAYIDGGEWESGIAILEDLHRENPEALRYSTRLAHACQMVGKFKKARTVVNHIRETFDRESPQLDILESSLLISEERPRKALELLEKAQREAGIIPRIHLRIGYALLLLNQLEKAEKAFRSELEINPEEATALHYLGITYYERLQYEPAVEAFLEAIGLMYYFPQAHYYLGEALLALGQYEDAISAFEVALKLAPGMNKARQRLITIYEDHLQQPGKAMKYRTDFEQKIQGEVIVVSGLPRSGTSMMMQMLEAGNLAILTDQERKPDQNNPKGYYEYEPVKDLAKNKKWLPKAKGKAVKVIAQLLEHLPLNYRYRIIFMERDIYEVVRSQQSMLARNGQKVKEEVLPIQLVDSYKKRIARVKAWAEQQPHVEILFVPHQEAIGQPFLLAMRVNDFLDGRLRPEDMVQVVDNTLYRERRAPEQSLKT